MMMNTGMPEVSCVNDIEYLRETLVSEMSEQEALAHFTQSFSRFYITTLNSQCEIVLRADVRQRHWCSILSDQQQCVTSRLYLHLVLPLYVVDVNHHSFTAIYPLFQHSRHVFYPYQAFFLTFHGVHYLFHAKVY